MQPPTCQYWINSTDAFHSTPSIVAFFTVYLLVGVLSLFGNTAVIYIVSTKKEMRTVTNIYICNLAFADILITLTSHWITPVDTFLYPWIFGETMCYFQPSFLGTSLFVSTFTLVGIAVDRYVLVLHPTKQRMSELQCTGMIIGIWLASILFTLPANFHMNFFDGESWPATPDAACHVFCLEAKWSPPTGRSIYAIAILMLKTVVPFGVIIFCYLRIACRLRGQVRRFSEGPTRAHVTPNGVQRQIKLQRILTAMVVTFGLCSAPLDILNLLKDLRHSQIEIFVSVYMNMTKFKMLYMAAHLLAMTATLLNPLLYAWWNENFKREVQASLSACTSVPSRRRVPTGVIFSESRVVEKSVCGGQELMPLSKKFSISDSALFSSIRRPSRKRLAADVRRNGELKEEDQKEVVDALTTL